MSDTRKKFGTSTGGGGPQYKNTKVGEKTTNGKAFRFFPALAPGARWFVFHAMHWGYAVFQDDKVRDPSKLSPRPFRCVEETNRKTEMVTTSCAECREIEAQEQLLNDTILKETEVLKSKGVVDSKEIDRLLAPLKAPFEKWFSDHNLDKKYYFAAIDLAGEYHVLRMGKRAKDALLAKIKELREQGIEPIDDFSTGVYFTFMQSGRGNETICTVDVYREAHPTERLTQRIKDAPVTEEQANKALEIFPELTTVARIVTPEQVKMLVESKGDPEVVTIVIGMSNRVAKPRGEESPSGVKPATSTLPPVTQPTAAAQAAQSVAALVKTVAAQAPAVPQTPPPAAKPAPAPVAAAPVEDDEETKLMKQLEAARAKKAAKAAAVMVAAPASPAASMDPLDPDMSPEEFAKAFGSPMSA